MGDLNLTYRFAQCEWVQRYVGVGARIMPDRYDARGGYEFYRIGAVDLQGPMAGPRLWF